MDLNKALGTAGAGQIVRAKGKEWTLLPPSKGCIATFQAKLESDARHKLVQSRQDFVSTVNGRESFDEDSYSRQEQRTLEMIYSGAFAWERDISKAKRRTAEGVKWLLSILLRQAHPNLSDDQVEEILLDNIEEFKLALETLARPSPKEQGDQEGGP